MSDERTRALERQGPSLELSIEWARRSACVMCGAKRERLFKSACDDCINDTTPKMSEDGRDCVCELCLLYERLRSLGFLGGQGL